MPQADAAFHTLTHPSQAQAFMLVLTRRIGETVMIGTEISVTVIGVKGSQVKLGINAPHDVAVLRKEIFERSQEADPSSDTQ